jgi:hypothetical protein
MLSPVFGFGIRMIMGKPLVIDAARDTAQPSLDHGQGRVVSACVGARRAQQVRRASAQQVHQAFFQSHVRCRVADDRIMIIVSYFA